MKATVNVAKESYENIKTVYANVLKRKIPKVTAKIQDGTFYDYVKNVYEELSRNESEERETAMHWLDVGRSEFDKMMCEVIALNLYCEIVVIEQLLNRGISRETYINEQKIANTGKNTEDNTSAFNKRLEFDRIMLTNRVTIEGKEENWVYRVPTICKAYRDRLFVPRVGTDIVDISEKHFNIFKALFDYKEENKDEAKTILSYKLWEADADTIKYEKGIYEAIYNSTKGDKIVQFMLMEKMFGLYTFGRLSKKTETDHEISMYAECMGLVLGLGYSRLHKNIINKLSEVNADEFENEVGQYISSLCRMCIYTCLNNGIMYIGNNSAENRKEIVGKFKNACLNLMGKTEDVFTGEFQEVNEGLIVDLYQKLYNINKSNLLEYLISTRELVSNFDNAISKTKTKNECFVYDYDVLPYEEPDGLYYPEPEQLDEVIGERIY